MLAELDELRACRTLEEFYVRANKYLRVENAEEDLGKTDSPIKNPKDKKEKKRKNEETNSNDQKWQWPEDCTPPVALLIRYTFYTELNTNKAEVFQASEG